MEGFSTGGLWFGSFALLALGRFALGRLRLLVRLRLWFASLWFVRFALFGTASPFGSLRFGSAAPLVCFALLSLGRFAFSKQFHL